MNLHVTSSYNKWDLPFSLQSFRWLWHIVLTKASWRLVFTQVCSVWVRTEYPRLCLDQGCLVKKCYSHYLFFLFFFFFFHNPLSAHTATLWLLILWGTSLHVKENMWAKLAGCFPSITLLPYISGMRTGWGFNFFPLLGLLPTDFRGVLKESQGQNLVCCCALGICDLQ